MRSKFIYFVFFLLSAFGLGFSLSRKPWGLYFEQKQKTEQALTEMKTLEKQREHLLRQKINYEDPTGMEELARQQGYHHPQEQPIKTTGH
jgi:hypothetical protein